MDMIPVYIERLEQAVRVMNALSEEDRANFDIHVIAKRGASGLRACIAGHCGLDPWFQAQGLMTYVVEEDSGDDEDNGDDEDDEDNGGLSIWCSEFFGTVAPFYRSEYPARFSDGHEKVTVVDAIAALNDAIENFKSSDNDDP